MAACVRRDGAGKTPAPVSACGGGTVSLRPAVNTNRFRRRPDPARRDCLNGGIFRAAGFVPAPIGGRRLSSCPARGLRAGADDASDPRFARAARRPRLRSTSFRSAVPPAAARPAPQGGGTSFRVCSPPEIPAVGTRRPQKLQNSRRKPLPAPAGHPPLTVSAGRTRMTGDFVEYRPLPSTFGTDFLCSAPPPSVDKIRPQPYNLIILSE